MRKKTPLLVRRLGLALWILGPSIAIYGLVQLFRGDSVAGYSGITAGFTVVLTAVYIGLQRIQLRQTEVLEQGNKIQQSSLEIQERLASLQEATQSLLASARDPTPVIDSAGLERVPSMPGFKIHLLLGNPGEVQILPRRYDVRLVDKGEEVLAEDGQWYALDTPKKREALAIHPFDNKPVQLPVHTNKARQDVWPSRAIVRFQYASGAMPKEIVWQLSGLENTSSPNMRNASVIEVDRNVTDRGIATETIRVERFDENGKPI